MKTNDKKANTTKKTNDITTGLTDTQKEKFIKAISDGVPLTTAWKLVHINKHKWYFWKKTAEDINYIKTRQELLNTECFDGELEDISNIKLMELVQKNHAYAQEIVDFMNQYEEAQANFVQDMIYKIKTDENNQFTKFAWLLERLRPLDFGRKDPDKQQVEEKKVSKIRVEFVDSKKDSNRLDKMDKEVQEEVLGKRTDG